MPKPVCIHCQVEFEVEKCGILVLEMASFGVYKVWAADVLKCPGCATEIIYGYGQNPLRQDHFAEDFPAWLEEQKAKAERVEYIYEDPNPKREPMLV